MSSLDILLLLALLLSGGMFVWGRVAGAGWFATVVYALMLVLVAMAGMQLDGAVAPISSHLSFDVLGQTISWRLDGLGWFFALLTVG
ncbi:MAG TPA: hypothetical protein ENJ57_01750, partial [Rhizobiales bacterium]|nr:hypothetical protein [Hyphomicrobiales bacterium]